MRWKNGDRIAHRFNPDLGGGEVTAVEGRTLVARFPLSGTTLRLAAETDALEPMPLRAALRARLLPEGEAVVLVEELPAGGWRLHDGREAPEEALWPAPSAGSPLVRLGEGEIDPLADWAVRLDALHLKSLRRAGGLGSFLGGRIRLFPHQLHVAMTATASDPVRWLLADEVGLGKTVEACLILNHLVHARRAEKILVIAPDTLAIQWLGELWRKHHQVFALIDPPRLADVARDLGPGFNPFLAHPRAVIGMGTLLADPRLTALAVEARPDLVVVDEAHHLRRPEGHPGTPEYRAAAPVVHAARHALLLTATPLENDAHGFLRLVQLLRSAELPDAEPLAPRVQALEQGAPLPPCTSSTRRSDIGGLPPRRHVPVPLAADSMDAIERLVALLLTAAPANEAQRRALARRVERALESGASLLPLLGPRESELREAAAAAQASDPRVAWVIESARSWLRSGEKSLVFTATRQTQDALRKAIEQAGAARVAVFHEDLGAAQRDIEVAQFRLPSGPPLLLSTESGGEGRNFEFCRRIVLFDLPWSPTVIEQRIGRLDRIGRRGDVEIITFEPPSGLPRTVHETMTALGLFARPCAGLERSLAPIPQAIAMVALAAGQDERRAAEEGIRALIAGADAARARSESAVARTLHRSPFRSERAAAILSLVPDNLDELTEDTMTAACERLGFDVEPQRGEHVHSIVFGSRAIVDSLPGVPGGARFTGTFDREEAVEKESIDYFAAGHPLVEGVLADLDESPRGRTAVLHLRGEPAGEGVFALYLGERGFEGVAIDRAGDPRPEWAERILERPLRTRRDDPDTFRNMERREETVEALTSLFPGDRRPEMVAWVRVENPASRGGRR